MDPEVKILERINKASLKFLNSLSEKDTYKLVVEEAIKLVNFRYGRIYLEADGELKSVYQTNPVMAQIIKRPTGFTYQAWKQNKLIFIDKTKTPDLSKIHPAMRNMGVKSVLYIPLSNRGKSIGVLIINSDKQIHFSHHFLQLLKLYGSTASLAIRKAQQYSEINKAIATRDLFISMAGHEFRTPLTTINGYIRLLQKKISKENHPVESEWIDQLAAEGLRMTYLVNELLEINRIRSGKLSYHWKESSLREILKRAMNNFRFSHKDRILIYKEKSNIQTDHIIADFDKLLQVFTNFLDNSVKFSPKDTPIALELSYRYPYYKVKGIDKGKGIDKKELPHVFEEFYKGADSHQGLGLGLFLAKNVIERHKGTISLKSNKNSGTTVTVRLPRAKV